MEHPGRAGHGPDAESSQCAVGKTVIHKYGWIAAGFLNGFCGLMDDRTITLDGDSLPSILTIDGIIISHPFSLLLHFLDNFNPLLDWILS